MNALATAHTHDLAGRVREQAGRAADLYRRMDALLTNPRPKPQGLPLRQALLIADELEELAERELFEAEDVADKVAALTPHITAEHRTTWWAELITWLSQDDDPDRDARIDEALAELLGDDRIRRRSA